MFCKFASKWSECTALCFFSLKGFTNGNEILNVALFYKDTCTKFWGHFSSPANNHNKVFPPNHALSSPVAALGWLGT